LRRTLCFLNEAVEADVENDECGQVGKHNLNRINIITDVENDECGS
jgi:hypothetical protein